MAAVPAGILAGIHLKNINNGDNVVFNQVTERNKIL
jgi:hypothetical protein